MTEKTELDAKREKLTAFIGGDVYRTLDKTEQSRLNRQLEAMTLYANILGERIAAFAPSNDRTERQTPGCAHDGTKNV